MVLTRTKDVLKTLPKVYKRDAPSLLWSVCIIFSVRNVGSRWGRLYFGKIDLAFLRVAVRIVSTLSFRNFSFLFFYIGKTLGDDMLGVSSRRCKSHETVVFHDPVRISSFNSPCFRRRDLILHLFSCVWCALIAGRTIYVCARSTRYPAAKLISYHQYSIYTFLRTHGVGQDEMNQDKCRTGQLC